MRAHSSVNARDRLARAIAQLPPPAREALGAVAERQDLPLVAGVWTGSAGGCLVANVVATLDTPGAAEQTLDLRVLELIPELGSRDLNRLIVAWDEAALHEGRSDDAALRRLLRVALDRAGMAAQEPVGAAPSSTSTVRSSSPRTTVSATSSPGE
ncbi:MAG TPA: hypothetical protein VM324_14385 [Egibacteraceae bacterium]|nr:hypothetical protein [Egibacteraceae bacterium]